MNEVLTCVNKLRSMVTDAQINDVYLDVTLNDLMAALLDVTSNSAGLTNISDTMKQELIHGLLLVKQSIATAAFDYYKDKDFDVDPAMIEFMRDVVEYGGSEFLVDPY